MKYDTTSWFSVKNVVYYKIYLAKVLKVHTRSLVFGDHKLNIKKLCILYIYVGKIFTHALTYPNIHDVVPFKKISKV